jgi:hypothetical protein
MPRRSRRLDPDLRTMTAGKLRQELMRVRNSIRWHRDLKDNARCHHSDQQLYAKTLPEQVPAGEMTLPEDVLFNKCVPYIRGQQCVLHGCKKISPIKKTVYP